MKHIADIIERGIRDHPELSVGMQTEGIEVRWRLSLTGQRVKCRLLIGQRMPIQASNWSEGEMQASDWLLAGEECGQHADPPQDGADRGVQPEGGH